MEKIHIPISGQSNSDVAPTTRASTMVASAVANAYGALEPTASNRVALRVPNSQAIAAGTAQAAELSTQLEAALAATRAQEMKLRAERDAATKMWAAIEHRMREVVEQNRIAIRDVQHAAVEFAVFIAERLLHREIEQGTFPLEQVAAQAIDRLACDAMLTVRFHPDDLAMLQQRMADAPLPWTTNDMIDVQADASLQRGDCLVESESRGLLANVGSQLEAARDALLEAMDED